MTEGFVCSCEGREVEGQTACCYGLLEEPVLRPNDLSFIGMFTKWAVEWGIWFAEGEKFGSY